MNDTEKEILFKSIENYSTFFEFVSKRKNLKLKDKIEICFIDEQNGFGFVLISINSKEFKIENYAFENIIDELREEKINFDNNKTKHQNKLEEERRRNVVIKLNAFVSKVHNEYIDNMVYASQIASAYSIYEKKLEALLKVFKKGNTLQIEELEIETNKELQNYLKKVGLKFE